MASGDRVAQNGSASQQTPMMTPKKTVRRAAQLDDLDFDDMALQGSRIVQQACEVKNRVLLSDGQSSEICSVLPIAAGISSEGVNATAADISEISSPVPTSSPVSNVDSTLSLNSDTAETNASEQSGDTSVAESSLTVVSLGFPSSCQEDSYVKYPDTESGAKPHVVPSASKGHTKHSSRHNNHHCSRGKGYSSKKIDKIHHSKSGWFFSFFAL